DKIQKTEQGWTAQIAHGITYSFNSKGRLTSVKPPGGTLRSYAYDASGRLVSIGTGPDNFLQYEYNNQNRVIAVRGPEGLRVKYDYDDKGRLKSVVTARVYQIQYDYSADGNLSTTRDQLGSAISLSRLSAIVPPPPKPQEQIRAATDTPKYQFD